MYNSKKDVDRHVRTVLAKKSENEKKLRGFIIAKMYYNINDYETARHYIYSYLSVKEDCAPAYKLLGQCYQQLKKPDKALESFQRSLQLDQKQPDLLIEICKLLLAENSINVNKAKYWCDLAESERVEHDAVFSLRLKIFSEDGMENKQIEDMIRKEIISRPNDTNPKVRLVKYFIEQNKIIEGFKYAYEQETKYHDLFLNCAEWYNVVWLILTKYKHQPDTNKSWEFWVLLIICLEKQIEISFSMINGGSITETENLLFSFDQYMFEVSQHVQSFPEKEFAEVFLKHFRGQICLYAASLMFKKEQIQNNNQWKECIKSATPLLLLAFQSGAPNLQEPWLKHCGGKIKQIIQLWNRGGAFRCSQAGRTLLSSVEDPKEQSVSSQVHQVITDRIGWTNSDELLSHVRCFCSDKTWRNRIFRVLFPNSDRIRKMTSSFLVNSENLSEPSYELPSYADIESYEEIAQYFRPQSLQHMVYLCLGLKNLASVRCKYFNGLNFSVQNLTFCGSESLNQLDIETFLYAATIQTKRLLEVEKNHCESYNSVNVGKPMILPFVNMTKNLCTEEQNNWWSCAYKVYSNCTGGNLSEIRTTLQYGIEAVRGINGPKMDLVIILKLGKIFIDRIKESMRAIERNYIEIRAEMLYKYALNAYKLHTKGILESYRKLFKYTNSDSLSVEKEIIELAENAVTYLATCYFKNGEYEECIEELAGIELPYATYFQAEAYKKLDESNKTPKKTKKLYLDKVRDCLSQTVDILNNPNIDPKHPLNSIVHSELRSLQYIRQISNENLNNGNFFENREFYSDGTPNRRGRHEVLSPKMLEMENLVKQIASTLTLVKEELVDMIKPEVKDIKKELGEFKTATKNELNELRDKLSLIEENMKKKSSAPSRDDASHVLEDLYLIGDEFQNQVYSNQSNLYPGFVQQAPQQQQLHRIQTPNALPASHHPTPSSHHLQPVSTPATPWYPASEYFANAQYMTPTGTFQQQIPSTDRQHLNLNQRLSFPEVSAILNFNPPSQLPSQHLENKANIFTQPPPLPPVSKYQDKTTVQSTTAVKTNSTLWNRGFNAPVEKGPPVNVVITSSDPLPMNTNVFPQPTLSVTIPPQHIKPSFVPTENFNFGSSIQIQPNTNFPIITQSFTTVSTTTNPTSLASSIDNQAVTKIANLDSITGRVNEIEHFEPTVADKSTDSIGESALNKSTDSEYDPRPDFKPLIPLPAEIEVKTGEEDEEVLFCSRAKLFRHSDKEWKDRGVGDIKILKSKKDERIRILMRRDQTHKVCANHFITGEMNLIKWKNDERNYIWAATDFADEEEKYEKLCVRFKQIDTAKTFYNVFTKARDEMKNHSEGKKEDEKGSQVTGNTETKTSENNNKNAPSTLAKSSLFNFNPTTNNQSNLTNDSVASTTVSSSSFTSKSTFSLSGLNQAKDSKPSPFAGFSFDKSSVGSNVDSSMSKPFANIFTNLYKPQSEPIPTGLERVSPITTQEVSTTTEGKNDTSDGASTNEVDDFVPTAEFKPVIPLPDLVEVQTGEENETVLFEHRAKLFRWDKGNGQWKERGIGNIKLLAEKNDPNRIRLLMRREAVLKVCCNLRLGKDTVFKETPNAANSLQFGGKDYSEEVDGILELFTIRFKTADICKSFHEVILKTQASMTTEPNQVNLDGSKVENKNENVTQDNSKEDNIKNKIQGFGDKFKPKPGSWTCDACCLLNTVDAIYCVACEAPKDNTIPHKPPKNIFDASSNPDKPKTTFTFGFDTNATQTNKLAGTATTIETSKTGTGIGFGDKFKPKPDTWSCKSCYLLNEGNVLYCVACETPKNDTVPKKDSEQPKNIFGTATPAANAFTFGFPNTTSTEAVDLSKQTPFKFGSTPAEDSINNSKPKGNIFSFDFQSGFKVPDENSTKSDVFAATPFSFGKPASTIFGVTTTTADNSKTTTNAPLPTKPSFTFNIPKSGTEASDNEFKLEKKEFNFTMKSKSPGKARSPLKNTSGAENESDTENVEEENNTYFTPVIPLPDKIEVKTGEEDEDVLYCHRAKLYRFTNSEWKERGLGDVKILRHKETKKLRVVMRREQVLKICLNHVLTEDIEYIRKDDKTWHFVTKDFSEGELELMQFCLRFKTKEISEEFMNAVKLALNDELEPGKLGTSQEQNTEKSNEKQEKDNNPPKSNKDENDVKAESKQELAEKLQLPLDFFDTSNHEDCKGCRGCDPESFVFPTYNSDKKNNEEDKPLPLDMSGLDLHKKKVLSTPILKQSSLSLVNSSPPSPPNKGENKSIFGNGNSFNNKGTVFNLSDNINLFGPGSISQTVLGQKSIFGGNTANIKSGFSFKLPENSTSTVFKDPGISFSNLAEKSTNAIFKDQGTSFSDLSEKSTTTVFKDPGISFSDLAAKSTGFQTNNTQSPPGGFYGLTQVDAFKNFNTPKNRENDKTNSSDANGNGNDEYDPHYEPIIDLPDEIKVVTGEENEEKLFGDRATLYRYDSDTKQWKERGVGELKILYHPGQGTYRLLLRRELIHKLVLNHAITNDFSIKPMNNSGKAFCWIAQNFAEEPAVWEKLACRFRNVDIGERFEAEINKCIEQLKKHADLEPEED